MISHLELRKEVLRLKNSEYPDKDEHEANPAGFEVAITEKTEQRVGDKNEPSDRGEQNQCEKVVRVTVSHETHIEQRTGNHGATYESTRDCKTADFSAHVLNLWPWVHAA